MHPVKYIDNWLNKITMYRMLLYGLGILVAIATIFGFTGVLSYSGYGILAVTAVLIAVSYITNKALAYVYRATTNTESYLITALILACILPPSTAFTRLSYIALAGMIATASKFVLAYNRKHIFNPAAVGAAALSLLGLMSVTWWIGNPFMLPSVMILGLLIVRKLHRFKLVAAYVLASLFMIVLVGLMTGQEAGLLIKNAVLSGPLVFFAAIMLTEPATLPVLKHYQILYGMLVGTLYSAQLHYGIFSTSPHMVLLAGNIFAFIVNPKFQLTLKLKERRQISGQVFDFVFTPDRKFKFIPGQYMEWTLGHKKVDGRGNRRSFTIASSPTEKEVHLGIKLYDPPSSFKAALMKLHAGDKIVAGHIAGNFTLPEDATKKLVFMAGGVGITPFRSMVKYLIDTQQKRDIILFYFVGSAEELAYKELFESAAKLGVRFVPVVGKRLSVSLLKEKLPGYKERYYYISGPNSFVESYRDLLRTNAIPTRQIVTDYFSGY